MRRLFAPSKIATLLSLAVASILIRTSSACRPLPNYQYATLEEQVEYASSIFEGRVRKVIDIIPRNTFAVLLEDYRIIKSGHFRQRLSPKRKRRKPLLLEINGFKGSSLCGPRPPKVGSRAIVFVCPNFQKKSWRTAKSGRGWRKRYWSLNSVALGAGVVSASENNLRTVRKLAHKFKFLPVSRECGRRPRKSDLHDFNKEDLDLPDIEEISYPDEFPY